MIRRKAPRSIKYKAYSATDYSATDYSATKLLDEMTGYEPARISAHFVLETTVVTILTATVCVAGLWVVASLFGI